MTRVALMFFILLGSSAPAFAEPAASTGQAIEIPGDGEIPFEQHPAMILTERDLNFAAGSDIQNSRGIALLNAQKKRDPGSRPIGANLSPLSPAGRGLG